MHIQITKLSFRQNIFFNFFRTFLLPLPRNTFFQLESTKISITCLHWQYRIKVVSSKSHIFSTLLIYHNHIFHRMLTWGEGAERSCPSDRQHLYLAEDSFHCTFWICWQETCSTSNQSLQKIDFCPLLAYGILGEKVLISQSNLNYLEAIIAGLQIIWILFLCNLVIY